MQTRRAVRCLCPHCRQLVVQVRNRTGPNFCPQCGKLFSPPSALTVPLWILGVLVILAASYWLAIR
jgi:hypothetical protein